MPTAARVPSRLVCWDVPRLDGGGVRVSYLDSKAPATDDRHVALAQQICATGSGCRARRDRDHALLSPTKVDGMLTEQKLPMNPSRVARSSYIVSCFFSCTPCCVSRFCCVGAIVPSTNGFFADAQDSPSAPHVHGRRRGTSGRMNGTALLRGRYQPLQGSSVPAFLLNTVPCLKR